MTMNPCAPSLDDGAFWRFGQQRLITLLCEIRPYLGPNFAIPSVPIRLRYLRITIVMV